MGIALIVHTEAIAHIDLVMEAIVRTLLIIPVHALLTIQAQAAVVLEAHLPHLESVDYTQLQKPKHQQITRWEIGLLRQVFMERM